ncbi:MAG: DEAD/DEAH box helicase [Deltaproteobacteria bacterium]|nr:DEAD/DEAH box helicase [Deltaproteobacteria bacterium]
MSIQQEITIGKNKRKLNVSNSFHSKLVAISSGKICPDSLLSLDTAMNAVFLKMVAGFDELLCLSLVQIEKLDYQTDTARRALGRMKGRAILADEVGLGKSIEAGLILKETMIRSMAKNVLILTPPSLLSQWQEELESKFFIPSHIVRSGTTEEWQKLGIIIASTAMAKRCSHAELLSERMFDLIIVDEAHHMKNRNTLLWTLVSRLKSKYLLLLTATPVQNSIDDLFNLITLLKPGQLSTAQEFKTRFVEKGTHGLSVRNVSELKNLVSDVMIRNTRAETGLELPPRQARTTIVTPKDAEQIFYADISKTLKKRNLNRMTTLTTQRMMGSLPTTALPLLKKLGIITENTDLPSASKIGFLEKYIDHVWNKNPGEKILVFTQFIETHRALVLHFNSIFKIAQIVSGQDQRFRDQEIVKFQQSARLMISTDAGSEGRNLQFCHHLVNFDIPWNPMRLEQRMGRLHRFGQKDTVTILNLCSQGSVEEVLLDLLDRKLNLFELVVGELSTILGEIEDEKSFEEQLGDLWLKSESFDSFREKMANISAELLCAKNRIEKIQQLDEVVFS